MSENPLERIRTGDRATFSALIREHQRSVFFLALRLSGGEEALARDVVQKTFLQAWLHRETFRGEASFKSWILRISANVAKYELRRAWRKREVMPGEGQEEAMVTEDTSPPDAFETLATAEARRHLREAVQNLPDQQQRVAMLRLYEDLSFKEVGEICGISANNAKVNFHHAVRNIRRFLASKGLAA